MSGFKLEGDKLKLADDESDDEEEYAGGNDGNESGSGSGDETGSDSEGSDDDEDVLDELENPGANKRKEREDDDEDEVRFVQDDLEGIDTSNIISGSGRRQRTSAMASGLSRKPAAAPVAPAPKSGAPIKNYKAKSIVEDDDEEAEF